MPNQINQSTNAYYNPNYHYTFIIAQNRHGRSGRINGSRRVIIFCMLTTILPTMFIVLPLYLRNSKYADVMYKISDSDVIQIHKGQSSVFCQSHSLRMNSTFSAFQMKGVPKMSEKRKHLRLKKSMILPDDTLEYWGFYLFKGATVELKACSRYIGSKVLVVKGDKMLNTCGILESNFSRKIPPQSTNQSHVIVTLETPGKKSHAHGTNTGTDNRGNHSYPVTKSRDIETEEKIKKREVRAAHLHNPNTILDAGVNHGGNAFSTPNDTSNESVSSFENTLLECYHEDIIINEAFPFSKQCQSTNYLEKTTILKVVHQVTTDGYYYYIFYSDNDIVQNEIHVFYDIFKPTFQYDNTTESKSCVNQTECTFNINFLSDEHVIVEMPTKDGFKNDANNVSVLISTCNPRVSVYMIFPILVLLLFLLFAFL